MRIFFLTISVFLVFPGFSQKSKKSNETYYIYDRNWKPCSVDSAAYLAYARKVNDSTYQWSNYHFTGSLINVETYSDENYSTLNGFLGYYDEAGRIDSSGYAKNGKRDRTWYFYNDSLKIILQKDYIEGKLIKTVDLREKRKEDTINKASNSPLEEKEADFKGSSNSWIRYLEKNYEFPKRAESLNKHGTVMISFIVDLDGSLKELFVLKSVEVSLDKEAWRLIEESPKWQPAIQKGKKVKAYRIQPITFSAP